MNIRLFTVVLGISLCCAVPAFAAHPLITDDPGTQGKGKFQLEVNGEYGFDKETAAGVTVEARGSELATSLAYGVTDAIDLVIGIPYQDYSVEEDGSTVAEESGLSDVAIEAKWRFFEKDRFALAFKPGVSLATGDEEKGLGTGKTGYSAFLIASAELEPLTFLVNLGYIRNENKADEQTSLWHLSAAALYGITERLTIVANTGRETNTDKNAEKDPAFALAGIIFAVSEDVDVDFGVKTGLNDEETDITYLAGIALRF
jgi:hypothetical protein